MTEDEGVACVEVRVVLPENPPIITPGAARLLLRIVRAAAARTDEYDEVERKAA